MGRLSFLNGLFLAAAAVGVVSVAGVAVGRMGVRGAPLPPNLKLCTISV